MYSEDQRRDVRRGIMRTLCEQEDRSAQLTLQDIGAALNITDWQGIVSDEANRLQEDKWKP